MIFEPTQDVIILKGDSYRYRRAIDRLPELHPLRRIPHHRQPLRDFDELRAVVHAEVPAGRGIRGMGAVGP